MVHIPPPPAPDDGDLPDPLAFTPVPLSIVRRNGWTEKRQRDFIQALAVMGSVTRAARAVGMSKRSAYALLGRPGAESFAAAWDAAVLMGYDEQLAIAMDRALKGVAVPRFYRGKQVATIHRYDCRGALAALGDTIPPSPRPAPRSRKNVAR